MRISAALRDLPGLAGMGDTAACEKQAASLSHIRGNSPMPLPCDMKEERPAREAIRDGVARMGRPDNLALRAPRVGATEVASGMSP